MRRKVVDAPYKGYVLFYELSCGHRQVVANKVSPEKRPKMLNCKQCDGGAR